VSAKKAAKKKPAVKHAGNGNSLRTPKKGHAPETRGAGRPEGSGIEIDLDELEKLCGLHATQADIAGWFNVSLSTIEKRAASRDLLDFNGTKTTFREIMERGSAKGRVSLRRLQMKAAESGNSTMLVWLGKQLLGQKDQVKVEHSAGEITYEELITELRRLRLRAAEGR
jgi:hypothetical protein